MEMEEQKKRKLDLDWETLLVRDDEEKEPEIMIAPTPTPRQTNIPVFDESEQSLTDRELNDQIQRQSKILLTLASKLPDNGEKIKTKIKRLEEEKQRRTLNRPKLDQGRPDNLNLFSSSSSLDGSRLKNPTPRGTVQSPFAYSFSKSMEKNATDKTGKATSVCSLSPYSLRDNDKVNDNCFPNKESAFGVKGLNKRREEKDFIVIDEEVLATEESTELPEGAKIYYPSRDDPKAVIIYYSDLDCLDPGCYISSSIMNFYIRYLQQQISPSNKAIYESHFFNTYFYPRLVDAVSCKGEHRVAYFAKLRRWLKGTNTNIFDKAYILIPIHEDKHWSLVIICIQDKETESGPVILHLDSLRFHSSSSIFGNIKSYLIQEWIYMRQNDSPSELQIADKLSNGRPPSVDTQVIKVPQQKNDYDCGLFVLFFIQRFIEEAPERLIKKNLTMFGRHWFKPEEASGLRVRIQKLLKSQFRNSKEEKDA